MARRSRPARAREAAQGAPASPYIRRRLPVFDPFDQEQLERLEAQVDWILQDVGIAFRDDPEALSLWVREGARVEGDIVRAPADWVRALAQRPQGNSHSWRATPNARFPSVAPARYSPRSMAHPSCATLRRGGAMAILLPFAILFGSHTCCRICTMAGLSPANLATFRSAKGIWICCWPT